MTLDEELVQAIDRIAQQRGPTRSAFARGALRAAIARVQRQDMERQQQQGYAQKPVTPGEFSDWEDEQAWGES